MDSAAQPRSRCTLSPSPAILAAALAVLLSALLFPGPLRAQAQPETVGRIYGDDIAVKGAISVEVENGRSTTLLASGSDVTVRSGQARLLLAEGGEIGICGPAHFSLLKSGGAITLALDYGRIHARMQNPSPLTVYTALIVATPVAIAEGPRDATIGLDNTGAMCLVAARGAVRIEQQLTGQSLLVPQGGEVAFAGGQMDAIREGAGSCQCEVVLARAAAIEGPVPPEVSVPDRSKIARPIKPPKKTEKPLAGEDPNLFAVDEPVYKVIMPPISFNAGAPPPPDPSPETMLLVREVRVRPAMVFHGRIEEPSPNAAPQITQMASASPPPADLPKKRATVGSRIRGFFRKLFGRSPCRGEGCASGG